MNQMDIIMLKSIAIVGFDGKKFYDAIYQGNVYLFDIANRVGSVYSNAPINIKSVNNGKWCYTDVKIEDLDAITEHKMYITYKGNEYEVGRISPRLKDLELFARPGHEEEDTKFGFKTDSMFDTVCHRRILLEEAESIRIESKDVYLELMEKYGDK